MKPRHFTLLWGCALKAFRALSLAGWSRDTIYMNTLDNTICVSITWRFNST